MLASAGDNYYMADYLLKAGAHVDQVDPFNEQTSLMIAVSKESVYTARLLISEGADLDVKDRR